MNDYGAPCRDPSSKDGWIGRSPARPLLLSAGHGGLLRKLIAEMTPKRDMVAAGAGGGRFTETAASAQITTR